MVGGRDVAFFNAEKRDKLIDKKKNLLVSDFKRVFPDIEFKPEFSWTGTFGARTVFHTLANTNRYQTVISV